MLGKIPVKVLVETLQELKTNPYSFENTFEIFRIKNSRQSCKILIKRQRELTHSTPWREFFFFLFFSLYARRNTCKQVALCKLRFPEAERIFLQFVKVTTQCPNIIDATVTSR